MPNWVKHAFTVAGDAAAVQAFRDGVRLTSTADTPQKGEESDFSVNYTALKCGAS